MMLMGGESRLTGAAGERRWNEVVRRRGGYLWVILVALSSHSTTVKAEDFNDYVDSTFHCPATVTCPQICVATIADCPLDTVCGRNETLCIDGSCAALCDDAALENPCTAACAPVACFRTVQLQTDCFDRYGTLYDQATACSELETAEETTLLSYTDPGFVAGYVWMSFITLAIIVWSAINQRLCPVSGSAQPLDFGRGSSGGGGDSPEEAGTAADSVVGWQTSYKFHPVGILLEMMTLLTLTGFHVILAWLTIQYYILNEAVSMFALYFEDEEQLLKCFIILWLIGVFWSFWIKFPYSIRTLFLRRCDPAYATHVAAFAVNGSNLSSDKSSQAAATITFSSSYISRARRYLDCVVQSGRSLLSLIFSDVDGYGNKGGHYQFCRVKSDPGGVKYFVFMFQRYNYSEQDGKFVCGVWNSMATLGDLAAQAPGLSTTEAEERRQVVGPNAIKMPKPHPLGVLFDEACKPFYTYQVFMIWSWFPLYYYYMAMVWSFVVTSGLLVVSWFNYRNLLDLYRITHVEGTADVLRDGEFVTVSYEDLVPGDIIKVQPGTAYCDAVLIESTNIIVDESALTGESNPMSKTAIDPAAATMDYDPIKHKRHTISAGTTVLESGGSKAVVLNTGAFTARGQLLRQIFNFKRHQFKFDAEVGLVLAILACYAIFGFAMVLYFIKETPVYGFFYGIYVVGTTLPPLLPTVFTVAVGFSNDRLAGKGIACTNAESILVAGKVTRAFFDKTGTLTKQGLDFVGARSVSSWQSTSDDTTSSVSLEMSMAMATCHTLTRLQGGALVGNPVDRIMFEASGASFRETADADAHVVNVTDRHDRTVDIIKHFDFDHHRMTQSVVVRHSDGSLVAFVKGSGESIKRSCEPASVPKDFDAYLRDSAKAGIYQISVAMKLLTSDESTIDLNRISRDDVESDLSFLGVLNFKNVIREETPEIIRHLAEGEVVSIMVTGDNAHTGIRIAREAGMIANTRKVWMGIVDEETDEIVWFDDGNQQVKAPTLASLATTGDVDLAVTGEVWTRLRISDAKEAARLAEHIRVYGRCTPQDKVSVIAAFVELGYITMMCGDGGNDCGALRAAHVGVALSDAEASMVAPFTSLAKDIGSVIEILKEGRCALASALASYKYLIIYGQVETILQIVNAYFLITFAEWCWVFMDGVWTITLAFSLPLARAADKLALTRPTASLLGPHTMASALGVLGLNFLFIVIALATLWNQPWFQCRKWSDTDVSNTNVIGDNFESETLFLVAGYQYISSAMAFNFGYEFRKGWFRNYVFVALVTCFTIMHFYIALNPSKLSCLWRVNCETEHIVRGVTSSEPFPIQNPFNTTVMPADYQRKLIGIIIANTAAICGWDYFVVNGIRRRLAEKKRQAVPLELTQVSSNECI